MNPNRTGWLGSIADDIRGRIPVQGGFRQAALIVLYVINKEKVPGKDFGWADLEIGCIGQNLFLEAAALGLGSCIFANMNTGRWPNSWG